MMSLHTAMLVGLLAPLVVAILTPFLAVRHVWRDAAGPIGGVITFIAAVHVALAVLDGETPRLFVAQIAEGLALEFAVTPLGAIFGLVASGLWILAALYSVGYMRGNHEKHQTRFAAFYAVAVHAAMAVAWSGNLLVLFVFYEILTFSTYPLVTHKESSLARNAGRLYMSILVGTSVVLLLPAVVWVWLSTGTLDFRPGGYLAGQIDPATRSFQALRIYVNRELDELAAGLAAVEPLLNPDGILAVVSFHSLEDRIVKRFLTKRSQHASRPSRHRPVVNDTVPSFDLIVRKAILPNADESRVNSRARSAKLRIARRTLAPALNTINQESVACG